MEPWRKIVNPCKEVREGRSFSPALYLDGREKKRLLDAMKYAFPR
jgi:hypothetical protein